MPPLMVGAYRSGLLLARFTTAPSRYPSARTPTVASWTSRRKCNGEHEQSQRSDKDRCVGLRRAFVWGSHITARLLWVNLDA